MDWKKAENLLEKWYDGMSTPSEEIELKSILQEREVPDHLIPDREIFLSFGNASNARLSDPGFDDDVLDAIDQFENRRVAAKLRMTMLSAAAMVILALTFLAVWFVNLPDETTLQSAYTEEEIRQAGEITGTTLMLISELLNSGRAELSRVSMVQNNLEKLNYLSTVNQGIKQLESIPIIEQLQSKTEEGS